MKLYAVSVCCHNIGGVATHVAYLIYGTSASTVYEEIKLHVSKYLFPIYCMQASYITVNVSDGLNDHHNEIIPTEHHLMYCLN